MSILKLLLLSNFESQPLSNKKNLKKMKKPMTFLFSILTGFGIANAQPMADITIGSSKQDKVFINIALRKQFSERFRAGIELQTGTINSRFISAKVINEGISSTLSF